MATRQYLIPGWGFVNETSPRQNQVPSGVAGGGILNETVPVTISSFFSMAGNTNASFVGSHLGTSTVAIAGVATVSPVGRSQAKSGASFSGLAAVSFAGATRQQVKSYFAPGYGYINETIPRQFNIPGGGYFSDTQTVGNIFSIAGRSTASFTAGASSFSGVGQSVFSARSIAQISTSFTIQGHSHFSAVGNSAFYTIVNYSNPDDLFNIFSFIPFVPPNAIMGVIGTSRVAFLTNALQKAKFAIAGHSSLSFRGQGAAGGNGQLDFSKAKNSGLIAGAL